jgi:hypothetical protein
MGDEEENQTSKKKHCCPSRVALFSDSLMCFFLSFLRVPRPSSHQQQCRSHKQKKEKKMPIQEEDAAKQEKKRIFKYVYLQLTSLTWTCFFLYVSIFTVAAEEMTPQRRHSHSPQKKQRFLSFL